MEKIERSFADGKEQHGQRYAGMRGLLRAQEQSLLSPAGQNMKKIALLLSRKAGKVLGEGLRNAFDLFKKVLRCSFQPDTLFRQNVSENCPNETVKTPLPKKQGFKVIWGYRCIPVTPWYSLSGAGTVITPLPRIH